MEEFEALKQFFTNMKKLLFVLAVLLVAMSAKAQVTWNIRAGGGIITSSENDLWSDGDFNVYPCGAIAIQTNIPLFKHTSKFSFSPTFIAAVGEEYQISFPLYFGYKIPIGSRKLFFPKIGPMFGYENCSETWACGPSAELAFEIKHFILSVNVNVNLVQLDYYGSRVGAFATIGYKF